jgi:hypothetical protein
MSKWWKIIVIGVLGLTALSKLLSLLNPTKLLLQTDPVFGVPIPYVMAGAGLLEIGICVFLAFTRDKIKAALAVFAFAVLVLSYRVGMYVNGIHYCPCLGNLVDWWPWLGSHEGPVMVSIALWLLLTSSVQLFQRGSKGKPFNFGISFSLLKIAVPIGLVCCFFLWLAPWRLFSCGSSEGAELSRMLLLLHRPEAVHFAWNDSAWLYPRVFASIFSITGFHFWIPRLVTLAIVGVAWMIFPRLMPADVSWPHLVFALLFFCSWPSTVYLLASAVPQMPALGLAVISAGLLPRFKEEWRWWRFVVAGVLLAIAVWMNAAALTVLPGIVIMLSCVWWRELRTYSAEAESDAGLVKLQRLASVCGAVVFVILLCLIAWRVPFKAVWAQAGNNQSPAVLVQKAANFLFSLGGFLNSPGTLLGAFWGIIVLGRQRRLSEISFVLALLGMVLAVHFLRPGWSYYPIYLAVPAAILAGFGAGELLQSVIRKVPLLPNAQRVIINSGASIMLGALVASLWLGFESSNAPGEVSAMQGVGSQASAALEVLNNYRGQVKWIYTRDNSLAVRAGYILPPELIDLSQEQFGASKANERLILDTVKKYQCEILVLQSNGELRDKEWLLFVQKEYTEIWSDGAETIFAANRLNPKPYPSPAELLKRQNL